uniref:HD domain-containing protein n=1 Tax=Strigamia maritima TaxID=126957 RepID=T1JP89_STRMM
MSCSSDLKARWEVLTSSYSSEISEKWWLKLEEEYSQESRKYHNLQHIFQIFQHYDRCSSNLQSKDAVAFAVFFHDLTYNPKTSDNEEKSTEIFKNFAKDAQIPVESPLFVQVTDLILLTKTHLTDEHMEPGKTGCEDKHYFLDFDMAILGNSLEDYNVYSEQIRQEYNFLSDLMYNALRVKVLKSFLQIPYIFATDEFRQKYEEQARQNIQAEIERLQG